MNESNIAQARAAFIRRMVISIALANTLFICLAGFSLRQSWRQNQERAEITTQNLAHAFAGQIGNAIDKIDLTVLAVADEVEKQLAGGGIDAATLNTFIARQQARLPVVGGLRVVNARGENAYGTDVSPGVRTSVADRAYFIRLRSDPQAGLVMSEPLVGRVSQKWSLIFARRINRTDGSFGGLVYGTIELDQFRAMFATVDVGRHGSLTLRDDTLAVIARYPDLKDFSKVVGQKNASPELQRAVQAQKDGGTYHSDLAFDKIPRTYTFCKIPNRPLYVISGLAPEAFLAAWRNEAAWVAALALIFLAGTLISAGLVYRDTMRKVVAVQALARQTDALRNSEAKLRTTLESTTDGMLAVDNQGKVLHTNRRFAELWHIPPPLLARGDNQALLDFVLEQLADPGAFLKKVQALYHSDAVDMDTFSFKDGRIFERYSCPMILDGTRIGRVWSFRDITERKRAEESLQQSETLIRSITDNSKDVIFVKDRECRFVFINPAGCRLNGKTAEQLIGRSKADLCPSPAESAKFMADDLRVMESGRAETIEEEISGADGARYVFLTTKVSRLDGQGHVIGLIGVAHDITARKQVEAALRQSEQNYREIFNSTNDAIFIHAADTGTVLDVNDAMLQLYGFSREEVSQLTVDQCSPNQSPYSAVEAQQWLAKTITEGPQVFEWLARKKSGELFWVEVALKKANIGGRSRILAVARDITRRKLAEEAHARLATVVEQAAESIEITDTNGAITYVNPAFEKTSGYTRAEAFGRNPRFLKSGKHDAEFYRRMWATLTAGQVWTGHLVNRRKDGTLYEEEASISPVRDGTDTIVNYAAVKRDVTREVQLENQFRQAQKMEAVGTLAGGIAHDFNNILAAMFGYSDLLQQDTADNAAAQEDIAEILKAANRAKELVQQILTFSRQREQYRQIIPLAAVVTDATKFLRASLPAEIKFEIALAGDVPTVLADATQIYQVIVNLATNALHAMEGRGGQLTVKLDAFTPDEKFLPTHPEFRPVQYARLTIADTGHGMDAATLERIFEPFFTTKPVGKGTGLGLSVVHGIVQSHEGIITVESQPGQGTTFCLYFPAQTANPIPIRSATSPVPRGAGQKILVVDDEPALTATLKRLLERLNYQVTTSNSARAAVDLFRAAADEFDLVITDLTMPEINGMELALQLHALRPAVPVLLASGFASALTPENLREAGICELLAKPVSLTALAEALRRALAQA